PPIGIESPSAAERAHTPGSTGPGTLTTPPDASLVYSRRRVPPVQRRPSPRSSTCEFAVPCTTRLSAPGGSSALERSSESDPTLGFPEPEAGPPAAPAEFRQPSPVEPLFAQGHGRMLPSP